MIKKTARHLALGTLLRVEVDGAYANLALADTLARSPLDVRDRAFCTELVNGTLRMRAHLDHLLSRLLSRPLERLAPWLRSLLRLSLYQLIFLPNLPAYAVVAEAVTLARQREHAGVAGLVNAVLRSFARRRDELSLPGPDTPLDYLAITLSHPRWLAARWLARLGPDEAFALARADNEPASLVLRVNTLRTDREQLLQVLASSRIAAVPAPLAPEGVRLPEGGALERLPGYAEGHFLVQDEGAMLVAHAAGPRPGESIIDLCAAPGGKTTHLAALAGDRAEIVALDDHRHRTGLIEENCRRLGITSVRAITADARVFCPDAPADAVLLDAPCSGTGVLRRRADLRWRRTMEDLPELTILQQALLESAARSLKPGGRIVYSTCSLEPEENEEQIHWFLQAFPDFTPGDLRRYLPPAAAALCGPDPWLYLWPHRQGTDGFFVCRMERRA